MPHIVDTKETRSRPFSHETLLWKGGLTHNKTVGYVVNIDNPLADAIKHIEAMNWPAMPVEAIST